MIIQKYDELGFSTLTMAPRMMAMYTQSKVTSYKRFAAWTRAESDELRDARPNGSSSERKGKARMWLMPSGRGFSLALLLVPQGGAKWRYPKFERRRISVSILTSWSLVKSRHFNETFGFLSLVLSTAIMENFWARRASDKVAVPAKISMAIICSQVHSKFDGSMVFGKRNLDAPMQNSCNALSDTGLGMVQCWSPRPWPQAWQSSPGCLPYPKGVHLRKNYVAWHAYICLFMIETP